MFAKRKIIKQIAECKKDYSMSNLNTYWEKGVNKWAEHWNQKANIENHMEINGYCIKGVPLSKETFHEAMIKPYLEMLELKSYHHVLEIGCGTGLLLSEIEKYVEKCIGIDVSQGMLAKFIGQSETILCAAHELPFCQQRFDRILMCSVAHYFPSFDYFKSVIINGLSILRKDGIFLIGDMLLGEASANGQYIHYNKHEIIVFCDSLKLPYSLMVQNRLKRKLNKRYDIILYKD